MSNNLNAHEVFWLARYAHNTLAPLIKAAQQYEPSIRLSIVSRFDSQASNQAIDNSIEAVAHWGRPGMFFMSGVIRDKNQLAHWAAKVQTFIDTEQAALEAKHDAEVQYSIEQADAEAARDWEFHMERQQERADTEWAKDEYDSELQNEYSGN